MPMKSRRLLPNGQKRVCACFTLLRQQTTCLFLYSRLDGLLINDKPIENNAALSYDFYSLAIVSSIKF